MFVCSRLPLLVLLILSLLQSPVYGQTSDLVALNKQLEMLFSKGKYAEAVGVAKRFLKIAERQFGSDHENVSLALNNLAELYRRQGRYAEAEPLFKRSLAIRERTLGPGHPYVGLSLNNLAALYRSQGRYSAAEPLFKRSLAIREKALGADHPDVGQSLGNLAELYRLQGRYADAVRLVRRSVRILKKAFGDHHPEVGSILSALAGLYESQGRFAAAETLHKRGLTIREKSLGPNHPDVSTSLNNLAILYSRQGRFAQAELLFKRSIAIGEKALGHEHVSVGTKLNNLASLYETLGRYKDAELLFKRSVAIRERILGAQHPDFAQSLNNLALLYRQQGLYAQAEPLFKRSLAIRKNALGSQHPDVARALNNLSALYASQGRYAKAEPLLQRSLAIDKKAFGGHHPRIGQSFNNLAELYRAQGRYGAAEPLYKQSLAIRTKAFGADHPYVGTTLNNLGGLYENQGRYAEAEPLFQRSLAIREKAYGADHPDVAASLRNLAYVYFLQSDWQRAFDYYRRGADLIVGRAKRDAQTIGQPLVGRKRSVSSRSGLQFTNLVKSAFRLAQKDGKAFASLSAEMFQAAQWAIGSEAAASLAQMAARQAKGAGPLAALVRERQDLVVDWQRRDARRTASVSQVPSKRNRRAEAGDIKALSAIDKRIGQIDKRLAAEFSDYAALASFQPSSISKAQKYLKANEALILFLDTSKEQPTPGETFIWAVTKTKSMWVRSDIETTRLRDEIDALRCGLDFDGAWKGTRCFDLLNIVYTDQDRLNGKALPFQLSRAHKLYKSLFGQIEELIKDKELLIVPSGPLTQLPFQVLVTKKPFEDKLTRSAFSNASWLVRTHALTVLPSVSSLVSLRAHAKRSKAHQPFIGFGNPLLDGNGDHQAAARKARDIRGCASSRQVRSAHLRAIRPAVRPLGKRNKLADPENLRRQTPLPETADELCAVARSMGAGDSDLRLGVNATETNIKSLSERGALAQYKILHFATHGALAGELKGSNEPGLILTPPRKATPKDDGYLSASEVAGLKLDADWVILSACNTAGGEAKTAEALSGLAKAFFYAGARSLLVSHWYVDSQATVALITNAFSEIQSDPNIGRAKAMQLAMLSLLAADKHTWHPSLWAPFVVVGEGSG